MHPRIPSLGALALAAALPAVLLVPGPATTATTPANPADAAAAGPGITTLTDSLTVRGDHRGYRQVVVTTEPGRGRIEVNPRRWPTENAGRYLHVGLGTSAGSACAVDRWVVVDTTDGEAAKVYGGAGVRQQETEQFTVPPGWRKQVARVGVAPFAEVDCVRAASYDSASRLHPGRRIWVGEPESFEDITAVARVPLRVVCPRSTAWGEPLELEVRLDLAPGYDPSHGVFPQPSVMGEGDATVNPTSGPFTVISSPDVPDDVDLWTAAPWSGAFVLDPDDGEVYRVRAGGRLTRDGNDNNWQCRTPVSMPVPTDWAGTLSGTTWWDWVYDSHPDFGSYLHHYTYEFLDDEWVNVSKEYGGAHTDPCTGVGGHWPWGCHRYYYDEASQQLQIDDRRARLEAEHRYWLMPGAPKYALFWRNQVVLPVQTGQRFRYEASSRDGELLLRLDGTFRYDGPRPGSQAKVHWSGTYRFLGGAKQQLLLRHDGHVFRDDVQLYFWLTDDGPELLDLDTRHRQLRFQAD
jgi:hypothetical protein